MAKSSDEAPRTVQRGAYICSGCKTEFEGTACPECGNTKGNMKLASDGIEHEIHKTGHLFGGAAGLRPAEDFMTEAQRLEKKRATMQMEEMDDNLREAYVLKSKLKLHDLEMQTRRKEIERKQLEEQSEEYVSGRTSTPPAHTQQGQGAGQPGASQFGEIPNMPFMQQLSPQAIFMQQLMRMDSKKRAEFIDQLSEADPGALANLSSMFQSAQPQQQQQQMYPPMQPNQYGQYPMMPPWMQQPQTPQPQHNQQADTISLVNAIFDLTEKIKPQKDDHTLDLVKELREENKKTQEKIDIYIMKERNRESDPQRLQIAPAAPKSLAEQVKELTSMISDLEGVGLVTRPGKADKTIDDELKLKEFDFKRETKNREIEIEESRMEAEKSKSDLTQKIVSSLLQRGIQKNMQAREDEDNPKQTSASRTPPTLNRVRTVRPSEPVEVISEVATEAGVVRETRRPVKKTETGGE